MGWIKRNLFFVIGSVVALALMGLAGWFLYTKWTLNAQILTNLNAAYEELKGLSTKNPHPGDGKINNIQIAREQQGQLSNYVASVRPYFTVIPRIPSEEEAPKVSDHDFANALSRTIEQWHSQAALSSVNVQSNYNFSFQAQWNLISFDPKGLLPLAVQVGEVDAICQVLFQAKVNSLENIRRERVSAEDSTRGLQADYLSEKKTTNELAILTPYEVSFKCFSAELAAVLAGFAASPHGMIVKTINVEGAPIPPPSETTTPTVAAAPVYVQPPQPVTPNPYGNNPYGGGNPYNRAGEGMDARMAARYGLNRPGGQYGGQYNIPRPMPQPQPTYQQPAVTPVVNRSGVLPTVLDERQLKVTINLLLIKMLPPK